MSSIAVSLHLDADTSIRVSDIAVRVGTYPTETIVFCADENAAAELAAALEKAKPKAPIANDVALAEINF